MISTHKIWLALFFLHLDLPYLQLQAFQLRDVILVSGQLLLISNGVCGFSCEIDVLPVAGAPGTMYEDAAFPPTDPASTRPAAHGLKWQ